MLAKKFVDGGAGVGEERKNIAFSALMEGTDEFG